MNPKVRLHTPLQVVSLTPQKKHQYILSDILKS